MIATVTLKQTVNIDPIEIIEALLQQEKGDQYLEKIEEKFYLIESGAYGGKTEINEKRYEYIQALLTVLNELRSKR